jgi:hypothetical protein
MPNITGIDAISDINRNADLGQPNPTHLKLSPETWEDQRLLSECPHCQKPIRFNPFICNNRSLLYK